MSRSADFLLIAAISAVVFSGCKKERSFRGANPGDEIVFGSTAGSASGFRSSKTKGCDGDSSVAGVLARTGLDSSELESCDPCGSDADETYFFDWEDFEGGEDFGCSDANALFEASDSDVQTKTEYSGQRDASGKYERIDWKVGDKIKIYANGVKPPKTECVYKVDDVTTSGIRSSAELSTFNEADGHGLMWDSSNADFYAVYPGNSPAKVFASNNTPSNFDVTVKLPKEQNIPTINTSVNHIEVRPDMELAAMMAVSRNVSPTSSVQLDFLPLVTTFRITIGNPYTTDDIRLNKVSVCYTPLASTPKPMSGDYAVQYDKASGGTLSSHSSGGLQPVNTSSITSPEQEISVNLAPHNLILKKNNGNTLSVTLFAVPVMHKGLQLKVNLAKGSEPAEDRILYLDKKQTTPFAPAEQLAFEPYKQYDINVGIRNKMEYHIQVSSPSTGAPYTGGSLSGWVRSYKTDGGPTNPASWWVEGYSETGATGPFTPTPPGWLTNFTPNGNGVASSSGTETVTASVSAQTATIIPNARTTALRGKSEVGTNSDPIDLSKVPAGTSPFFSIANGATASTYTGNPMNTANCYVVTRPGWYKIPVVYGNAIKNNGDNQNSYKPSGSGNNFLTNFIRHDGNAITKPWIKDNGISLNTGVAELLWQDQPNLVQNIALQSDKKYIVFHVSQSTIHEGNAVIALKESATGDIVWSWHIWVCGSNDLRLINVKNNKAKAPTSKPGRDNFDFLSENLGACDDRGEAITYPESKVWVKISNGRKTEVIKIIRVAGSTTTPGYNSPYYQWGRKDPMLPSDGTASNQNKFWFDKDGTNKNNLMTANWSSDGSVSGANAEIANTIKNPHIFNINTRMDNLYYNLWDANCNETGSGGITTARFEPVTKSVYDPCPPGFCLPPNGAFTGFTRSGNNSNTSSEWNVSGSFNKGWNFRTVLKGESGGTTIFFPASGYRSYDSGVLHDVGGEGDHWSSVPFYTNFGGGLHFFSGYVSMLDGNLRSYGFVLCPVLE